MSQRLSKQYVRRWEMTKRNVERSLIELVSEEDIETLLQCCVKFILENVLLPGI